MSHHDDTHPPAADRPRARDRTSLDAGIELYPAGTPDAHLPAGAWVRRTTRSARTWADVVDATCVVRPDVMPVGRGSRGGASGRPPRALTAEASARHRFGAELRRWRTLRGLTQGRLGALIWYSAECVGKVEKGERWPSQDLAQRCDQLLETSGALSVLWPAVEREHLAMDGRRRHRP